MSIHTYRQCHLFRMVQKWVQYRPMVLFRRNVKKIKVAVHKNSDIDVMCKQSLSGFIVQKFSSVSLDKTRTNFNIY